MNKLVFQITKPTPVMSIKRFSPPVRAIARISAELCFVTLDELLSRRKPANFVRARALAIWGVETLRPDLSYPQIGSQLNRQEHTTLLHQYRLALKLRESDPDFLNLCHDLLAQVSAEL